ncbi:unnamed protein product [Blepharisma stoltei]|uniref:Proteinase inhibitor I42 chagasin domain-containing protein n=1 Tax=Blepharisma stoltei TaxID=1481888 RepID=A0AAU9IZT7_9CILI|nr:unnamed protein product [Blepharisma stoltei]
MRSLIFMCLLILAISDFTSIDNVQEFTVIIGKTTNVTLVSNPTTGYSWFLNPSNSEKLKVPDLRGEYRRTTGLIGGAGIQVFKISCSELCADGESLELTFEYKRPWEAEPIRSKLVTAKILANPDL